MDVLAVTVPYLDPAQLYQEQPESLRVVKPSKEMAQMADGVEY
jgi:hypothetical protein